MQGGARTCALDDEDAPPADRIEHATSRCPEPLPLRLTPRSPAAPAALAERRAVEVNLEEKHRVGEGEGACKEGSTHGPTAE